MIKVLNLNALLTSELTHYWPHLPWKLCYNGPQHSSPTTWSLEKVRIFCAFSRVMKKDPLHILEDKHFFFELILFDLSKDEKKRRKITCFSPCCFFCNFFQNNVDCRRINPIEIYLIFFLIYLFLRVKWVQCIESIIIK